MSLFCRGFHFLKYHMVVVVVEVLLVVVAVVDVEIGNTSLFVTE